MTPTSELLKVGSRNGNGVATINFALHVTCKKINIGRWCDVLLRVGSWCVVVLLGVALWCVGL